MAIDVWSKAITINRPRSEVIEFAFDPIHDTEWIGGIKEARLETPGPVAIGSRIRRRATFVGKQIPYLMEVRSLSDDELQMHAIESPLPMDVTYRFDAPGPSTTSARIRVAGDTKGYYRLVGPLVPSMIRRSVTGDLRRLKRILESRPSA